jgi:hypothetical protein
MLCGRASLRWKILSPMTDNLHHNEQTKKDNRLLAVFCLPSE